MIEVYFLRHGQTLYNQQNNRYCGRTDVPLTPLGLKQARNIHQLVQGISFEGVYSSPLERAYHTAILASGGNLGQDDASVMKDDRLIEVDFGQWEGLRRDEFSKQDPESWLNWDSDPGRFPAGRTGETAASVIDRVDRFFDEMLLKYTTVDPDLNQSAAAGYGATACPAKIMVVAHNGVNRLYLAHKLGMPLRNYRQLVQDNSTLTIFTLESVTSVKESERKGENKVDRTDENMRSSGGSLLTLKMLNGRN